MTDPLAAIDAAIEQLDSQRERLVAAREVLVELGSAAPAKPAQRRGGGAF